MNETLDILRNRRSVRAYRDEPVNPADKEAILAAAMRAPTAGNMMLYTIIEVSDQKKKDQLAESCDHQPFIAKAPLVLLFLADYQRWMDYYRLSKVEEACARRGLTPRLPQEGDLFLACCDALIAAQTAVVAAESLGIGSCYIGDIMEKYEFHRDLFGLPQYTFPITLVCFGHPTVQQQERPQPVRFPRECVVYDNTYRRLDDETLRAMHAPLETGSFLPGAENAGQHNYLRKFVSDFSREMSRSARAAMDQWLGR